MKHIAVLLFACLLPLAVFAGALPTVPYVQVTGHGSLTVVPDMAHVSVTVEKTGEDMAAARADVERRTTEVITSAKRLGVTERDISANTLSIWPEYRWQNNTQIFVGQHVSRRIEITLHDLGRYADLVSALVKAGVNNVNNTTLGHSGMPELRRQALAQAVDDAHARAVALTGAANVSLGSVFSITENAGFSPRPMVLMAARTAPSSGGAEYAPGTIDVSADVSIVYLLKAVN